MELKTILQIFVATLLCGLCAAGPAGKEFALSFMQNYIPGNKGGPAQFIVEVSSPPSSLISTKVKVIALGKVWETTLQPGIGKSIQLPAGVEMTGSTRNKQTVQVEANQDILVLSLNSKPFSADTSVIYPVQDWGTEYFIYTPQMGPPDQYKEFAITNHGILNTVEIQLNGMVSFEGQEYPQGSKLVIDLEPFESVLIQSKEDLTGSKVSAKQPVAVFTGHSCTWYFTECNHVYEQLLPVSSWGKEFIVATLAYTKPSDRFDSVIIQASENTEIQITTQDGVASPKQMVAGETLYINLPYPNSLHFITDKGVQVLYEFNGGINQNGETNDPFLITVLSKDRFSTSYAMASQAGFTNEAIIIAQTKDLGKLTLDQNPFPNDLQWTQAGESEYSWTQIIYTEGTGFHQVSHPDSPFALYSFGASKDNGYGSPAPGNPPATVGVCWVMGDPHYRTFDSSYYNFMGNCTYIMAKNCHVDSFHPAFEVQTENERLGSTKTTTVSKIIVNVYGINITIVRHETGIVRISDSLWYLPISLDNGRVTLQQSGLSVIMKTNFGLSVQYDWDQYLVVNIPGSFIGRMCGMCGNFNGRKEDDLTTPTGSVASSIPQLGMSWRVPGLPGDAYCSDDCVGQCESCQGESWFERLAAKAFCHLATLLTDGPFQDCNSVIDPKIFYENCLFDYCMGKGYKNFLCKTAEIYTDACQRAGIRVHDWRYIIGCSTPKCPANSHFESCACPATCENPTPSAECKANCVEACTCDDGYLWSGNKCVPKNQCGCMFKSGGDKRYLQAGESIWADDNCSKNCTCNPTNSEVVCENSGCSAGTECSVVNEIRGCHPVHHATCNIYGDPHYNTFDNSTYAFQGTCTYTAAQGCHLEGTQLTPFAVIVENAKWNEIQLSPNVSMANMVIVQVYGMTLVLQRNQLYQIMVNGLWINIPASLDDGKVRVQREGNQNVILTNFGLRVTFNMIYHVTITVPSSYAGRTCGLCGNFNGNKNDEFLLPNGKETKELKTFVAAWKVLAPGVVCDDGCSGDFCPKCPEDKKIVFEKDCSIITNPEGPFAACHSVITPDSYFQDCAYDVCMGEGNQNMLCHDIAAYMTACQDAGVIVQNWRTPTFCPLSCPANSAYEICAKSCDVPCPGLTEVMNCNIQTCAEGCMCKPGFFNNGTGCVTADQCACYENGLTYKINETVITESCQESLTCLSSGKVSHETIECSSIEVCEIKNGVRGCYPKPNASPGICWVMGDPHYRTFDGEYYNFMGNCTYIMAKNCHVDNDHPALEVQAMNKRTGSSKAISVSGVIIQVYGQTITILQHENGFVRISDSLWYLPISLDNGRVTLQQSGLSVVMKTDFGLSVQYDWDQYLLVNIPVSFMGRMCGMCGNFNGMKGDDLTTPTGSVASSIPQLGKSWRVPGVVGCTDDCVGQCESCQGESWFERLEAKAFCHLATLLTDGPLRDCNSLIDPKVFYENCLLDYCMGKGFKNFLCKTAEIYTDACQRAGIHVHDWRHIIGCPTPKCPANSHFESCACPATCENPTPSAECKANCVEACTCDDGYLWSGNKCVPKSQCGCVYKSGGEERYLQAGESIWADNSCSKNCTCNPTNGEIMCENANCPVGTACNISNGIRACQPLSHAICNIYGDPHYNTFDNSTYDFQGTCTYTAAQGCHLEGTQLTPFAVIVENEKWNEIQSSPNVSMAKVVAVEVYGMILVLRRNQLHQIMVNGVLTNIPVNLNEGEVIVQQEGYNNVISTNFGLRVAYDMIYHVTVTVPSTYLGKTCGMCGNYNGNKNDDFLLPDGKETKELKTFGAAWKVAVPGVVCDDGCSGDFCPKCSEDKKLIFEKDCSIITNPDGPFAACHSVINPDSYFQDCVYDVCTTEGDQHMLCHSIAAYMTACHDFEVHVNNWRTPTFCPLKCPENSAYEICATACDTPCPGLTDVIKCNIQTCVEGCRCKPGFFNNGTGCVKEDQCSCYENGKTFKIGEVVVTDDCQEKLICQKSGIVKQESMKCNADEVCQAESGVRGCYPKQCMLEAAGSFTLFNGTTWNIPSMGAFELVKVCDDTVIGIWFRVVAVLQEKTGVLSTSAVHIFFENAIVTVTSQNDIWFNGRKMTLPTMEDNNVIVKVIDQTVIVEKTSALRLSYSLSQEVIITVNKGIADQVCGACGKLTGSISGESIMFYMDQYRAPDFPTCTL
ncbi:IgGFc-binding protein [Ictalurus punctatus]|uniref:IgGFc-binding protein n=1 Tax=Ictalurus punctatus TaxID=7998 RepID=A0A2D0S5I1_ICTPU|nr:IgGFc-binding protein [Ictalurus punctatus]